MLTASQATVVAYSGDGDIVHARPECIGWDVVHEAEALVTESAVADDDDPTALHTWTMQEALATLDYSAWMRYTLDEYKGEVAWDRLWGMSDEQLIEALINAGELDEDSEPPCNAPSCETCARASMPETWSHDYLVERVGFYTEHGLDVVVCDACYKEID